MKIEVGISTVTTTFWNNIHALWQNFVNVRFSAPRRKSFTKKYRKGLGAKWSEERERLYNHGRCAAHRASYRNNGDLFVRRY